MKSPYHLNKWALLLTTALSMPLTLHAQATDPPATVAWLGEVTGAVSVSPAGTDQWLDAPMNRPLTTGDRIWVKQGARAEVHIGPLAIRLGPQTNVAFASVTDEAIQLSVTQGTVNVHADTEGTAQKIELDTPNLAFVPSQAGIYRVDVPPSGGTTAVKVLEGQATVYGQTGRSDTVASSERIVYSGTDASQSVRENNPPLDSFDLWSATRDQVDAHSESARYVSRGVVGYQALDAYGSWTNEPAYGPVWVPRAVRADWAPYQDGHWAWIAPWGWTWVDDAPWGFAPCHYGRWAWSSSRWMWVPGPRVVRPVYAPALVAFVAAGRGGTNARITLSSGAPGMAWLPLGPGEAYRPTFHASPHYVTVINQNVVIHKTDIHNQQVYVNAHVPHAISAAPVDAFTHGQAVHANHDHVRPDVLQGAHFVHTADIAPANQPVNAHINPPVSRPNLPDLHQASPAASPTRQVIAAPQTGKEPVARPHDVQPPHHQVAEQPPHHREVVAQPRQDEHHIKPPTPVQQQPEPRPVVHHSEPTEQQPHHVVAPPSPKPDLATHAEPHAHVQAAHGQAPSGQEREAQHSPHKDKHEPS